MNRSQWKRSFASLVAVGIVLVSCRIAAAEEMPGLVHVRTLQSLSAMPDKVFSKYLNLDTTSGAIALVRKSNENNSGTYWAIRFAGPVRGYMKTCQIESRSNSPLNARLLSIDRKTGDLKTVPAQTDTDADPGINWYLRYAGKHNGYDAYVLQTLTDQDRRDFQFLGLDPVTGKPRLTAKLDETTQWFLWPKADLPTEP